MHALFPRAACFILFAALTVGCGLVRPARFCVGAKYYDRATHRYYGKVVAYDSRHDFAGGLSVPAIAIELDGGKKTVWAACNVIELEYEADKDHQ